MFKKGIFFFIVLGMPHMKPSCVVHPPRRLRHVFFAAAVVALWGWPYITGAVCPWCGVVGSCGCARASVWGALWCCSSTAASAWLLQHSRCLGVLGQGPGCLVWLCFLLRASCVSTCLTLADSAQRGCVRSEGYWPTVAVWACWVLGNILRGCHCQVAMTGPRGQISPWGCGGGVMGSLTGVCSVVHNLWVCNLFAWLWECLQGGVLCAGVPEGLCCPEGLQARTLHNPSRHWLTGYAATRCCLLFVHCFLHLLSVC